MMRRARAIGMAAALLLSLHSFALAVQPDEMLRDPALEARARALSRELRCMVCQNQSIDDSDAPLARDLRLLVRERLKAGDGDAQVLDFLVARYGEFVLLRPRVTLHSIWLWLIPFGLLAAGAAAVVVFARKGRQAPQDSAVLTPAEQARVAALLARDRDLPASH
jgi:cytochrome c-type biogenesis protein CcmH